jgi:hypothetical protein
MPVLEDGLSDSENRSDDEQLSSVKTKSTNRHQSTQSNLVPSHKQQFAKHETQSQSFYIRPQASSSQNIPSEESSTIPTGRLI